MPLRRVLPLALVALISREAGASPKVHVELRYETDPKLVRCPSEADFRAAIGAQLGYDPFSVPSQELVVARARDDETGIRGTVEWYSSGTLRGERELGAETRDCAALMRAMSFAIAVQIQLFETEKEAPATSEREAATVAKEPERSSEATPARNPSTAPTSADRAEDRFPQAPSRDGSRSFQVLAGAGPAVAFGIAPRPAFEGRILTMVRYGSLGVELGGEASLPTRYTLENGDGFEQWTAAGSLAACGFLRAFSGCVVSKLGSLSVRGFGVEESRSDSGFMAEVGLRLAFSHPLAGRCIGTLRVEALSALTPWEVSLNDEEAWRTPPFSLIVGADVAALFQ